MNTPFKILKGTEVNLPTEITDGQVYFCTDTGNLYIDINEKERVLVSAKYAQGFRFSDMTTIEADEIATKTDLNDITSVVIRRWNE